MLPQILRKSGIPSASIENLWERILSRGSSTEQHAMATWTPRADITDEDSEITIDIEIPGMKKEEIKVEIYNSVLTISGDRKRKQSTPYPESSSIERNYGRFERSFVLPDAVDEDRIFAGYQGGVLTLHMPKTTRPMSKEIEVELRK